MRNTFIILLVSAFQVLASGSYAQTKTISLAMNHATISEVLSAIENQSEFYFLYNSELIDVTKKVDVEIEGEKVDKILARLFSKDEVDFLIKDRYIVLTPVGGNAELFAEQQQPAISGTVTDESGLPLPGVTVVVKGTTQGTVTNADGNYSLSNIPEDATLVFSFVGMLTQELVVGDQTNINIEMVVDVVGIEEVVAVGYGSLRKSDLTGSVSQIKTDEIIKKNSTSVSEALQGLLPAEVSASWKPGTTPRIEIRGINSITGSNDPLWVVDGIPMQSSNININPIDIESVDILKDASATAIYGSRGSNGVIIVTTKSTKPGKSQLKISYNGWVGLENVERKPNMQNGIQHAEYRRLAAENANMSTADTDLFDSVELGSLASGKFTDWFDLVWGGTAFSTDQNVSVNASGEKIGTTITLGYLDQNSLVADAGYKRYNLTSNNIINLSKKVKITTNTIGSYSIINDYHQYVRHVFYATPLGTPYDNDGKVKLYPTPSDELITNPLAEIQNNQNETKRYGFIGSATLEWEIYNGLKYKLLGGVDYTHENNGQYFGSETRERSGAPFASRYSSSTKISKILDNVFTFDKSINEKHRINAVLGFDMQTYISNNVFLEGTNMDYDGLWYNLGAASTIIDKGTSLSEWGIMSTMGRLNYSFSNRYLATLTYRYDGSSRLAKGNKWKGFPSASVAWRLSEEDFMKDVKSIYNLKLRASWGNIGNTNIAPYETLGRLSKTLYDWNEIPAIGYHPTGIPNPDLTWERTEEYNGGIDLGMFNNRLSATMDLYDRTTKDLMLERNLPITSGFSSITQNIGSTRNKGIELTMMGEVIKKRDFSWTLNITFAKNKNQILDLFGDKKDDVGSSRFIGHPIRSLYLLDYIGVWQESEAAQATEYGAIPGDPKFRDITNSEGQQRISLDEDRIIISRDPAWIGALNSNFKLKSVELGLSFYTRQGVKGVSDLHELSGFVVDYWTPENPTNESPAPNRNDYVNLENSDFYVYDLSFVRLSNVNLAYVFSQNICEYLKLQGIKAYINIKNPYVWTKYDGMDPQNGTDREDHPPMTSYQFGVNINF